MRKRAVRCVLWVGAALLLAALVVACGEVKSHQVGTTRSPSGAGSSKQYAELRWGMTPFPGALDLTKVGWSPTYAIELLAAQNLMEFEPDGKVKLGLASAVEQPNSTTYVYHLKSVKFSDGRPLTAADVVYSLDRNINGVEAWTKSYFEDVASIAARNSSTVVVKLKRPLATFQEIIAFTGTVIEKAAAERAGEKAIGTPGHLPIGTGPWKIDSFKPESSVELSRNPYWTGPPQPAANITIELFKTEALMALALRSGAIDGADTYVSPKVFANIPGVKQLTSPGEQVVFVAANTKRAPFNDVHVRRALAFATDSKGMIEALYSKAEATEAPWLIPTGLFSPLGTQSEVDQTFATAPKFEFDLGMARQELAKSAYPHGFTMQIEVGQGVESQVAAAQILTSDYAKIGVKATVHEVTPAIEASSVYGGKGTFWITDSTANYPDPETFIGERLAPSQIYPKGGGTNVANYYNSAFDRLYAESAQTLNRPKRLRMIGEMARILRSQAPSWPLLSPQNFMALSSKYAMSGFSYWTTADTAWAMHIKPASP